MEVLSFHLRLKTPFASNRKDVVLNSDVDLLRIDTWQIGFQNKFIIRLINVG